MGNGAPLRTCFMVQRVLERQWSKGFTEDVGKLVVRVQKECVIARRTHGNIGGFVYYILYTRYVRCAC